VGGGVTHVGLLNWSDRLLRLEEFVKVLVYIKTSTCMTKQLINTRVLFKYLTTDQSKLLFHFVGFC